jgi:hypothetical protein
MMALSKLGALTERQNISTQRDSYELADAATVFLCAEHYIGVWLQTAYQDTGRIQLRDALRWLEAMRVDLLSLQYEPGVVGPDVALRLRAAKRTLVHAMRLLEDVHAE